MERVVARVNHAATQNVGNMQPKITNLVNQHKKMAEQFLRDLIDSGAVPKKFSGVITPKFGNMIFTWQFNNNRLVGSTCIHVNNIDNYCSKLKESVKKIDWLDVKFRKEQNDERSGEPVTDTTDAV